MKTAFLLILLALPLFTLARAADQSAIKLAYNVLPPFKMKGDGGEVVGLVASEVERAFTAAAIPFVWVEMPNPRQMQMVAQSREKICAVGLYKTPEREAFAKFSKPLYREQPFLVVSARGKFDGVTPTLKDVFADPDRRLVLMMKRSYGSYLDALIGVAKAPIAYARGDDEIIKMVENDRGNTMLLEAEKFEYYVSKGVIKENRFTHYSPTDGFPGEFRYLLCSKSVDDAIIDKVNNFLPDLNSAWATAAQPLNAAAKQGHWSHESDRRDQRIGK